jgi:hypothetical protein
MSPDRGRCERKVFERSAAQGDYVKSGGLNGLGVDRANPDAARDRASRALLPERLAKALTLPV